MTGSIWSLTVEQLANAQAKLTYLGEQTKIVPTVALTVEGHKLAMVRFLSVQRTRKPYANDESPYTKTAVVSRAEFQRLLAGVQPIVDKSNVQPNFVSFTVVNGAGAALVGQEFFISRSDGKQFYAALLQALSPGNDEARALIRIQLRNVYPE